MTSKSDASGKTIYTYNFKGKTIGITYPDGLQEQIEYDAQDRLAALRFNGRRKRQFVFGPSGKFDAELNGSGNLLYRIVYGTRGNSPDLLIDANGVAYRIITDQIGSVRLVVNASTLQVMERIDYDEFGRVLNDTNPGYQPFGFAGGVYNSRTLTMGFGARVYDPDTGRWLTKDPIGFAGGDTNLYGYVVNDPIDYIDPTGLYHFVGGAHGPFTAGLDKALQCFDQCTGRDTAITSGNDSHGPNDPHSRGEACDVGRNSNPDLSRSDANRCFSQCFTGGYGQEEYNSGPGTHFHFQTVPGVNGGTGMAPGIQPHGPLRSQ